MNKPFLIILFILLCCNAFCQSNYDARMLGLNGAYTTVAKGYKCIGINPANLGSFNYNSANIFNISFGISTNSLSISNYNALNGANLEDTTATNYYPGGKTAFYNSFDGKGIRIMQSLQLPFPMLNFSRQRFALTSNINTNIDMGVPNGMVDLLLNGNPPGEKISIDMEQLIFISEEMGISYGHSFNSFAVGFTLKYILGLFYVGMETIDEPYIITDYTALYGQNQYLIKQALGGSGTGLDIGITSNELKYGYRFGISIINILGTVKWTQDNFIREKLSSSISDNKYYLEPNEFIYINMVFDSISAVNLDGIYYEMYNVIPLENISDLTISSQDSTLLVSLSDGTFLYPSGGEYKLVDLLGDEDTTYTVSESNYEKYSTADNNPFITRQPMFLRMGISRRWEGQAIVAADLVTGFSDRYGSSSSWKLSIGTEISRFKNKFLRLGYAFGGLTKKSMSFGYGQKIGNLFLDLGFSLNGGYSLETAKGIDIAFGLTWQKKNTEN